MNNIINYKDIMAFHPGYFVAEIVEEMGITQDEFATRMGTTGKTLSNLIGGHINLSNDLAKKLSTMLGSSIEFWLRLQKEYDEKILEIKQQQEFDAQADFVSMIDYSYFEKVANLPHTKAVSEKVANLCQFFTVSDLRILAEPDFLVNYRSGIANTEFKNIVNARAWIQTALNFARAIETKDFNATKLKTYLSEIRNMTTQNPEIFIPRLREIFSECGVAFVLLPHLKNSGINGAVKWINAECVVLAINDRRMFADTFWFSLFHEIKHVLQQKTKTVFVSSNVQEMQVYDKKLEEEADQFAQNYLIPEKEYTEFIKNKHITNNDIIRFASEIGTHPGVVVGRLQHDKILSLKRCADLKQKYKIVLK